MLEPNESKPWWQSRGVIGGVVGVAVPLLGLAGYHLSPDDAEQVVVAITSVAASIGGIIAIIGRVKATKQVR